MIHICCFTQTSPRLGCVWVNLFIFEKRTTGVNYLNSSFILLILLSAICTEGQTLTRDSVAGTWMCVEATIPPNVEIPQEASEAFHALQSAVVHSKFVFKDSGYFEWQFPTGADQLAKQMIFLNGQPWSVNVQNNLIHVGVPKENLMQVFVRKQGDVTYFMLADTPLLLRVQKE